MVRPSESAAWAGVQYPPDYTSAYEATVTTDTQGHWSYDGMPSDSSEVQLMISHPAFVGTVLQAHSPRPTFFELTTVASHMPSSMAVPEMPGGRLDEPLDLGTIALKRVTRR